MRFPAVASFALAALAFAAAAYGTFQHVRADRAVVDAAERMRLDGDFMDAVRARADTQQVGPMLANPVVIQQDYRVSCGTVDGGAATDCAVPMDGGSAANPVKGESWYIAPIAGSSVNVRVGTTDVTSSTGFEVGASGRDGAGISMDARGPIRCKSEGAAQQVDVIVGRQ